MSDTLNLTGVWQGLYTYPSRNIRVLFDATFIESGSWLTGSTVEACTVPDYFGQTLFATLLGKRQGAGVTFDKTYQSNIPGFSKVEYAGMLNGDGTEIEGDWTVSLNWSGKFLMIRSRGNEYPIEQKVFERI